MFKYYRGIKSFILVIISLSFFECGLRADKPLSKHEFDEIELLSRKISFNLEDAIKCFSIFITHFDPTNIDTACVQCLNKISELLINEQEVGGNVTLCINFQGVIKNLLIFYMELSQNKDITISNFYAKYYDVAKNFKRLLQPTFEQVNLGYFQAVQAKFFELLTQNDRLDFSTKKECRAFTKIKTDIISTKEDEVCSLKRGDFLKNGNVKVLRSPEVFNIFNRLVYFTGKLDYKLIKFISLGKNEKNILDLGAIPDSDYVIIDCFLSLESEDILLKDIDLSAFTLYLNDNNVRFIDGEELKPVTLFNKNSEEKFSHEKLRVLNMLNAKKVPNGINPAPLLENLLTFDRNPENIVRGKFPMSIEASQKFLEDAKGIPDGYDEENAFSVLFWENCLFVKDNVVQHVLMNNTLGRTELGDKYLLVMDRINFEENSQKLVYRLHMYPTDTLLLKAVKNFIRMQREQYPEPVFLDYNATKACFELLDLAKFQSRKKAVYARLNQDYEILKRKSAKVLNHERIELLLGILLQQKESDTEEFDGELLVECKDLIIRARTEIERIRQEEEARRLEEQRIAAEAERIRLEEEAAEKERLEAEARRLEEERVRAEAERIRQEEEARRLEEQRIAAEAERIRLEEEAKKPKGFTGQQIMDRTRILVQHSPMKVATIQTMVKFKKIQPGNTYMNKSQLHDFFHPAFDELMNDEK